MGYCRKYGALQCQDRSRLTRRLISLILSFSQVVAVLVWCEAYPTITLHLHTWCLNKYEESQGDFLKDVSKISKRPWPNTSQNTRVLQRQLDSALAEREQKFGREVSVTTCQVGFLLAHLTKPDYIFQHLESPGLQGWHAVRTDMRWSLGPSAFMGYFTWGLKILNIWQNTVIFSCPISW